MLKIGLSNEVFYFQKYIVLLPFINICTYSIFVFLVHVHIIYVEETHFLILNLKKHFLVKIISPITLLHKFYIIMYAF